MSDEHAFTLESLPVGPKLSVPAHLVRRGRKRTNLDPEKASGALVQTMALRHHRLAQLVAQGMSDTQVAIMSGFSPTTINKYRLNPAFVELVEHYRAESELAAIDELARMKLVGNKALDVLDARLDDQAEDPTDTSKFSQRELLETVQTLLVNTMPQNAGLRGSGGSSSPSLVVNFVSPSPEGPKGVVIDGEIAK